MQESKKNIIDSVAREILIKTKRKIFSQNLGNNSTTFVGNGLDFSELREYYFGDDVRKINWKATAKVQRPYINLFTEERELNIVIAFMTGGGISFGSKRIKQELMTEVYALLAFSAMKNGDNVTTLAFSNKEEYHRRATKSINALHEVVPKLLSLDSLGKEVDYEAFSSYMLGSVKQKSIVFVVGDFYEELDLTLLSAKHEVYAVVVRDKFEEEPQLMGMLDLIDPNSMASSGFEFNKKMLKEYKEVIEKKDKKLYEHFMGHHIRYVKIYTDEEPYFKLNNLVR
jgi:uncharacterized protein (DUF58 family)